jgi:tRNA(fMet)-specific endonuclease VapC
MLDTNVLVSILRGRATKALIDNLDEHRHELCVSTVTLMELETGVALAEQQVSARLRTDAALARLEVLPYDDEAARRTGQLRGKLIKAGNQIGPFDSQLAGHALAVAAVLVTNNVREFSRVEGLTVQDWL